MADPLPVPVPSPVAVAEPCIYRGFDGDGTSVDVAGPPVPLGGFEDVDQDRAGTGTVPGMVAVAGSGHRVEEGDGRDHLPDRGGRMR